MKEQKGLSKPTKRRIFILLCLTTSIFCYLSYNLYTYWYKIDNNYATKEALTKELNELLSDEQTLKSEIVKLNDPEYVAQFAREKYLYSKNGEIIFRIIK